MKVKIIQTGIQQYSLVMSVINQVWKKSACKYLNKKANFKGFGVFFFKITRAGFSQMRKNESEVHETNKSQHHTQFIRNFVR